MSLYRLLRALTPIVAMACLACSGDVGGLLIGNEIDEITNSLEHTVAKAGQDADFVVEKNARMLGLLVRDAKHLLSEELDKRFDQLSTENQKLVNAIREAMTDLDGLAGRTLELEEFIVLDLQNLINQIPFKQDKFLLRRIEGYSQNYQSEGAYDFRVVGNAFGPDSICEATINGFPISNFDIETSKANQFAFSVPVAAINSAFRDDVVNRVPFTLIARSRPGWKQTFTYSGQLLLLPKLPVKCTLKEVSKGTTHASDLSWTTEIGRLVAKGETVSVRGYPKSDLAVSRVVDRECAFLERGRNDAWMRWFGRLTPAICRTSSGNSSRF